MRIFQINGTEVFLAIDHIQNENLPSGGATPSITPTVYYWVCEYKNKKVKEAGGFIISPGQVIPQGIDKPWLDRNCTFVAISTETPVKIVTPTEKVAVPKQPKAEEKAK